MAIPSALEPNAIDPSGLPQPAIVASALPRETASAGVTVLIAAYNAEAFLERAVNSALRQTSPPGEIIIVDDASLDGTAEAARALTACDSRIRLLRLGDNRGPAGARNAGIEEARGDWIAVLDADDAFLPDRLERLQKIAEETNADVVADNFLWRSSLGAPSGAPGLAPSAAIEIVDAARYVARARPFVDEADWGLLKPMFRKAFLDAKRLRYPTRSRHGEDFLLMFELLLAGARYVVSRTPGYLYTARSSGMSRTRVDYDAMAKHTLALAGDARVRANPRLKALLAQRSKAVRRLAAQAKLATYRREGRYLPLAVAALSEGAVGREMLARAISRARSWLRRTEAAVR